MRPRSLTKCLRSIQQFYPNLRTDVLDTGGNVSWGRNVLVNRCQTPYFVLLEDDMEFTEGTRLESLLEIVKNDPQLLGCGGYLEEDNRRNPWHHDWWEFRGVLRALPSRRTTRISPKGHPYLPCQLIQNFGVFRTEEVRKFPWDEELPVGEHLSWFYSIRKQWLVGYCESVKVRHHSDRDRGEYDRQRGRAKTLRRVASDKLGLKLTPPEVAPAPASIERPCIVVLGVGHSNTTITTKQIAALGWELGDADEEFAESVSVRDVNDRLRRQDPEVSPGEMKQVLARLPRPWVVKDPRFFATLPNWLSVFAPYAPLLVWVSKSLDVVEYSYERRGENVSQETLERRYGQCEEHYRNWPWATVKLDAAAVAQAVSLYDLSKMALIP